MTVATQGLRSDASVRQEAIPLVVQAQAETDLAAWARERKEWVDTTLTEHGALLFRGFTMESEAAFQSLSSVLCGPLLDYMYRSTPRTTVGKNVYTATEYRADARIAQHNENAFQQDWPMRLAFCCVQPAAAGGETPLAHSARVTARIDADVVRMFARRRVMYVRNYGHGVDLPWETTFQTSSRAEVESYCREHSIEWEWLSEGRLRTRQVCQGVAQHPVTGQELWFNQAHLFHVSGLGREQQAAMLDLFGEADLPRNAYFGDGAPLDEGVLDHVRQAYEAETVVFPWMRGDVLLVDNMLVSHGRMPYSGARRVLVAMGTPFSTL